MSNSPPRLSSSSPALSPLPNEVSVSILARISKSYYSSLCLVSKSFYSLLSSPDIYTARSEIRATEPRLYLYLRLPNAKENRLFTLFDKVSGDIGLAPVRLSSSYAPTARSKSTSIVVGSEIYQIGGGKHSKSVRVFDCRSNTWRRAPRLTVPRKNAKSCFLDGKIYVIGGRKDESMVSGEVFDLNTQIWKPLPIIDDNSINRKLQVVVLEGRLNVITKKTIYVYNREQGTLHEITNKNKYVYDMEQGRWLRDDVLFVGLEKVINRPFCVIEDVIFARIDGEINWYDSRNGKWSVVKMILDIEYQNVNDGGYGYDAIRLVNHGGKLVIIWHCSILYLSNVQCDVIKLEKRLTPLGIEFWGEVERFSHLRTVPYSSKLLSCLSVSL